MKCDSFKLATMDLFFYIPFNSKIQKKILFHPNENENQGQIMGWHKWNSIFMITMVSSQKYHLRKNLQYSVHSIFVHVCTVF